jgi:uncharacterized membrane protein YkvI
MKKGRKIPWWIKTLMSVLLLGAGIFAFNHIAAWLGFVIILLVIVYVLITMFNKFKDYVEESED